MDKKVLTLLRPAAHVLASEAPGVLHTLLDHTIESGGLPAALAWMMLQRLPDAAEQVGRWAPAVLQRCWELQRQAFAASSNRCGALALAGVLAQRLRADAAAERAVLEAIEQGSTAAALLLVGGPWQSPARQLQVVAVPFGRALVVDTQQDHVKVVALDTADGTHHVVQKVCFTDLPTPPSGLAANPVAERLAAVAGCERWGAAVAGKVVEMARATLAAPDGHEDSWGNHLSNTTCLTHAFLKSGKYCSTLWCSLTRRSTHKKQARPESDQQR